MNHPQSRTAPTPVSHSAKSARKSGLPRRLFATCLALQIILVLSSTAPSSAQTIEGSPGPFETSESFDLPGGGTTGEGSAWDCRVNPSVCALPVTDTPRQLDCFWGSPFQLGSLNQLPGDLLALQVSVWVRKLDAADLSPTTSMQVQIREGQPPYAVLTGWSADLDLTPLEDLYFPTVGAISQNGALAAPGTWLTAQLAAPSPLPVGLYHVGVQFDSSGELGIAWQNEEIASSTFEVVSGYIEMSGLSDSVSSDLVGTGIETTAPAWRAELPDPFIGIRQSLDGNFAPIATQISVNPYPPRFGDTVTLTGTAFDSDGTIESFDWSVEGPLGESNESLLTGSGVAGTAFVFSPLVGQYRATLVATDDGGKTAEKVRGFWVNPSIPPNLSHLRDDRWSNQLREFLSFDPGTVADTPVILNTYSVGVNAQTFPVTEVRFQILDPTGAVLLDSDFDGSSPTELDGRYSWEDIELPTDWSAGTYQVVASATDGIDTVTLPAKSFEVTAAPSWTADDGATVSNIGLEWFRSTGAYKLEGFLPPGFSYSQDLDLPFIGTRTNSASLGLSVEESFFGGGNWYRDADSGLAIQVLGFPLPGGNYLFDTVYCNSTGSCLSPPSYQWSFTTPDLIHQAANVYDGILAAGFVGPIYYTINLTIDVAVRANLTLGGEVDADTLEVTDTCVTPNVIPSVPITLAVEILFGVASAGVDVEPSLQMSVPICYGQTPHPPGSVHPLPTTVPNLYLPGPCLTFAATAEFWVKTTWGYCPWCYEAEFRTDPYDLVDPPYEWGAGCAAPAGLLPEREILQSPQITSDNAGNSIAVWIHDAAAGLPNTTDDPDVYYSYRPNGGSWSVPAPVDLTVHFETDPRVVFTQAGQALLVVTRTKLDPDQCANMTASVPFAAEEMLFAEMDLVSYTFDSSSGLWTSAGPVLGDPVGALSGARPDGRSELAAGPGGSALAVWVRDPDGQLPDDLGENLDSEVWSARWNGTLWEPALPLATGPGAHLQPDVAISVNGGDAVAVWTRDADGNPWTNSDRTIEYAFFDYDPGLGNGIWVPAPSPAVAGPPGLLFPSVEMDPANNRPIIVCTKRGPDSGILAGGGEMGEGTSDFALSAIPTDIDGFPWIFRIDPVGGPDQVRVRDPQLALDPNEGTIYFGGRMFTADGPEGFDGEVGISLKRIEGGVSEDLFPAPAPLDRDSELDWQVEVAVDPVASVLRAIWVRPADRNQTAPFGDGYDGIRVVEIPIGPSAHDLALTNGDVYSRTPYAVTGEEIEFVARIDNIGNTDVSGIPVDFYLDALDPGQLVGTVLLDSGYRTLTPLSVPWTSDGLDHTLIVVVDPANALAEIDESNNIASALVRGAAPPAEFIVAPLPDSILLRWRDPSALDPAAPRPARYRIERDVGTGFVAIAETLRETYVDREVCSASYRVISILGGGSESLPTEAIAAATQDPDGDGLGTGCDNCPEHDNPAQIDGDGTDLIEDFTGGFTGWSFEDATDGLQSGSNAAGNWSTSVDPAPGTFSDSAHLIATSDQDGSGAGVTSVAAAIRAEIGRLETISFELLIDEIGGSGDGGESFLEVAIIDAQGITLSYGFSTTGDIGGDLTSQVFPFTAQLLTLPVASDFAGVHGTAPSAPVEVRFSASADFAELAPPGARTRSTQVFIDTIVFIAAGDGVGDLCDNCPDHFNPGQADCDTNGTGDVCAIALGLAEDCDGNGVPDSCDIATGTHPDANGNGVPDLCDPDPNFRRGDCNGDSAFDIADPIYLLSFLFSGGPPGPCDDACDANDDGDLDIADPIAQLAALFTGGSIPIPAGTCGLDPTSDGLGCAATPCP